jgi:hypothetical protein
MRQGKVYEAIATFKGDKANAVGDERFGKPSTVIWTELKEEITQHIQKNRSIINGETASEMRARHGKKQYNRNLRHNQKGFIPMDSGNEMTAVLKALRSREIMVEK